MIKKPNGQNRAQKFKDLITTIRVLDEKYQFGRSLKGQHYIGEAKFTIQNQREIESLNNIKGERKHELEWFLRLFKCV